jgi:outer membrane protein assembly factor BamB
MMNQPTVYVGAQRMKSRDSFVYALEADIGSLLWLYALHDTSSSFPVASTTGVYFSAGNGSVYALRTSDGSLLWQQQLNHQFPSPPVIANGLIYVSTRDAVYALQATDGSLRWQQPVRDLVPIRPVATNERVYARSIRDGSISALQANDGALLWRTPSRGEMPISLVATQDVVYLVEPDRGLSALSASDGSPLWHQPTRYTGLRDPIMHNGMLYLNAHDSLHARRASDGSLLWRVRARGILSLAAMNSMLVAGGGRNTTAEVSALRAGDGSRVWRWRTSLQEGGVTTPVVTHEAVYVGIGATDGLYALHVSNGSILWHALGDMGVTTAAVGESGLY